jgi:hypothetical protein
MHRSAADRYSARMTSGIKLFALAVAVVGAIAVAIHLCAPELMHSLGQALHGGR